MGRNGIKYRFNRELKKAVLLRRADGYAAVIIDGEERQAQYHSLGSIGIGTAGVSCLLSGESGKYTVEAVSSDEINRTDKGWIGLNPMLFEQAVGYFLRNHQMKKITGNWGNISRLQDAGHPGSDIKMENVIIELKIPLSVSKERRSIHAWKGVLLSIRQLMGYYENFAVQKKDKRVVLLTGCQDAAGQIYDMPGTGINKDVMQALKGGIEFWVAEMEFETDGISLLSYYDITDKLMHA